MCTLINCIYQNLLKGNLCVLIIDKTLSFLVLLVQGFNSHGRFLNENSKLFIIYTDLSHPFYQGRKYLRIDGYSLKPFR